MKLKTVSPLRRQGSKARLLSELFEAFPTGVTTLIEPFVGSLSVSIHALQTGFCEYVVANDSDNDVVALWEIVRDRREDLIALLATLPVHEALFASMRELQTTDPLWRAVRLLYLSNFSYLGAADTFRLSARANDRKMLRERLIDLQSSLFDKIQFASCDFRDFFRKISMRTYRNEPHRGRNERDSAFCYADPPYVATGGNFFGFSERDLQDLITVCMTSGVRFAISEFDTHLTRRVAETYGLRIRPIVTRRTLGSRDSEILMCSYP